MTIKVGDLVERTQDSPFNEHWSFKEGYRFVVRGENGGFYRDDKNMYHSGAYLKKIEPIEQVTKPTSSTAIHLQQIGRGLRPNRLTAQDWIDDHKAAQRLINRYGLEGAKKLLEGLSDDD